MTEDHVKSLLEFSDYITRLKATAIRQLLAIAEKYGDLRQRPENRPLYQLNLLEIIPTEEPHTSKLLAAILDYEEDGRHILLESFIERFLSPAGLDKTRVKEPVITAEEAHIDVLIRDNDYAIIIENKLMNAPFQRNQLGRYIEKVHRMGYDYERIYLVLLPHYYYPDLIDDIRPSVWRCPPDGLCTSNTNRNCRYADQYQCWCDDKEDGLSAAQKSYCDSGEGCGCIDFLDRMRSRTIIVHSQLSDWLSETEPVVNQNQTILRSAIHQFADFIKGLYNIRINNHLLMDIQKIIKETLIPAEARIIDQWNIVNEKAKELSDIQAALSAMKQQLSKDLIDEWYHELKPEFEELQREAHKSFGINIKGVWVGCWCGSHTDGQPLWGFYCENKGNEEQREMVREIIEECEIPASKSSANFICWDNTPKGAEICRAFYNAAMKLGHL